MCKCLFQHKAVKTTDELELELKRGLGFEVPFDSDNVGKGPVISTSGGHHNSTQYYVSFFASCYTTDLPQSLFLHSISSDLD